MKLKTLKFVFLLLALALVLSYCAKQVAPSGGPKDETPPVIVKSIPVSGITNFKEKEIEIEFNEYVQLDKLNEKFMMSPPANEKPDIYLRGKSLFIKFNEDLKDSTTYTLYFADAVKDLNEGNPIENFQFVFATGSVIDSLSVTGNVLQSENLDPGKNVLVVLHSVLADSAPRKILPDYITLADINGGFRINNVKEGKYRMYALIDNNSNKKYDLADEVFAFLDTIADINHFKNWLPIPKDTARAKPVVKPLKPGEKIVKEKVVPHIDGEYTSCYIRYRFPPIRWNSALIFPVP
jgi:Bacterial Ig-like domain